MARDEWPLTHCKEAVARRWGGDARYLLGDRVYEALLNSELLMLSAGQDESIDPATIVGIMRKGRTQIIEALA